MKNEIIQLKKKHRNYCRNRCGFLNIEIFVSSAISQYKLLARVFIERFPRVLTKSVIVGLVV